jgi:hypothetical protein
MRSRASNPHSVHAYGQATVLGLWIECADCGLRRASASETLPPCPSYTEATHLRAGWLLMPLSERHGLESR